LEIKSTAPSDKPVSICSALVIELIKIIGISLVASSAINNLQISKPFILGIKTSNSIISGFAAFISS
jgi:hypothetical protein